MKEKMLEVDNDDDRKYAAHCLGILSLPFQLNEDIKLLIHEEPGTASRKTFHVIVFTGPLIDCKQFSVSAEEEMLGEVSSFIEAVALLITCYFVFNIAYPPKIGVTMTFIQKVLVGHDDQLKSTPKLLSLLGRITKH
ncbi:uncharacterized protein LOC117106063 [Anneissia japonica]|uniref:uncharacterized protein LOC117106063 n=1 Tax=Anneissia japonica TaxID=1529436 RepID=UPI0014256454|nr:uncharacterized protein LOC117106063 [Anneissia japonica]